jgi:propionyl-CoA carboxylase alpha chain
MGSTIRAAVFTPRAAELTKYVKVGVTKNIQPDLIANIAGLIVDVKVKAGDKVVRGQPLVVIEAMKMENIFFSQVDGVVSKVHVEKGVTVASGDTIIAIEPE